MSNKANNEAAAARQPTRKGTCCGLYCIVDKKEVLIPLQSIDIKTRVTDFTEHVVRTDKYKNDEEKPIEAVYVFPLNPGSAVHHFVAKCNGKEFVALVKAKEAAKKEYEDAAAKGQFASIVLQYQPNVFKLQVANIAPKSDVTIEIHYVNQLKLRNGRFVLNSPIVIAPKYTPSGDGERIKTEQPDMKYASSVPYKVTYSADCEMGSNIKGVVSTTHPQDLHFEQKGNRLKISTLRPLEAIKDVCILIQTENPYTFKAFSEVVKHDERETSYRGFSPDEKTTHAVVKAVFTPDFDVKNQKTEQVVVGDVSGSMQSNDGSQDGKTKLQLMIEGLNLWVDQLPEDCYFNVFGFDDKYYPCFTDEAAANKKIKAKSVKYSPETLEKAKKFIRQLEKTGGGGTELMPALHEIMGAAPISGYELQVHVLTDGQFGNIDEVTQYLKGRRRIFGLGIGSSADENTLEKMSKMAKGSHIMTVDTDKLPEAIASLMKNSLQPSLHDIEVTWAGVPNGVKLVQTPAKIPAAFRENSMVVYATLEGGSQADLDKITTVTLKGKLNDGQAVSYQVPIVAMKQQYGVNLLAGRSRIRDLEDETSDMHSDFYGNTTSKASPTKDAVTAEMVALSKKYNILCRDTAFVLVDPTAPDKVVAMESREVPQYTSMYESKRFGGPMMAAAACAAACAGPSMSFTRGIAKGMCLESMTGAVADAAIDDEDDENEDDKGAPSQTAASAKDPRTAEFEALVSKAEFNGSFQFAKVGALLKVERKAFEALMAKVAVVTKDEQIVMSCLMLLYLNKKYPDLLLDKYERVQTKLEEWLAKVCPKQDVLRAECAAFLVAMTPQVAASASA